jgi:hypothetical protein
MKPHYAIFGLERMQPPDPEDKRSGQPYLFRKYPDQFGSLNEARKELEIIMNQKSPFVHFRFDNYVILEVVSKH